MWPTAMADFESLLNRWQSAGVLNAEAAARIRAFELQQERPAGLRWQGMVALILGAILLACGVVLFVSAHWDEIGPGARYVLVIAMVAVFHLTGAWARERFRGLSTALHAVGTIATGAAIALVGQIFNIQEHWPGAVMLWAIAAAAGWILLRDEAQQTLALLLFPAWLFCEFSFAAQGHIGQNIYLGRFLVVWAVLYLTVFLGSRRKAVDVYKRQGLVIAINNGPQGTFTVRKMSFGQGVERIFPFNSKVIDKIEKVRSYKVRRAKLFYIRGLRGKAARLREVDRETGKVRA